MGGIKQIVAELFLRNDRVLGIRKWQEFSVAERERSTKSTPLGWTILVCDFIALMRALEMRNHGDTGLP